MKRYSAFHDSRQSTQPLTTRCKIRMKSHFMGSALFSVKLKPAFFICVRNHTSQWWQMVEWLKKYPVPVVKNQDKKHFEKINNQIIFVNLNNIFFFPQRAFIIDICFLLNYICQIVLHVRKSTSLKFSIPVTNNLTAASCCSRKRTCWLLGNEGDSITLYYKILLA